MIPAPSPPRSTYIQLTFLTSLSLRPFLLQHHPQQDLRPRFHSRIPLLPRLAPPLRFQVSPSSNHDPAVLALIPKEAGG